MARGKKVNWRMEGEEQVIATVEQIGSKTRNTKPAFNTMAATILEDQRKYWASHGASGGKRWAPRKEPYRTWMRKNYPQRPILRGPDRKGHKGLQLRNQLTRRPFGVEVVSNGQLVVGTNLPYAQYHQNGIPGRMVARPPLKPFDPAMHQRLSDALAEHLFAGRSKSRNPLRKGSVSQRGRR